MSQIGPYTFNGLELYLHYGILYYKPKGKLCCISNIAFNVRMAYLQAVLIAFVMKVFRLYAELNILHFKASFCEVHLELPTYC